jgi:uncharacterized protein YrzB (UPF0473 family)
MNDDLFDGEFYTLTDDEGNESQFELIGTIEDGGETYYALVPVSEDEPSDDVDEEYVILKKEKDENGEDVLVTIEDDDEFERIADQFDAEFADIDYDVVEETDDEEDK